MIKKTIQNIYFYWLDWKFSAKFTSTILNVTLCGLIALLIVNYMVDTREQPERTSRQWISLGDQILLRASEKVGAEVKILETLARTPSIIAAANEVNQARANWTSEMIASQDKAWSDQDPGIQTTIQSIAENPVSTYLVDFRNNNPEEVEVFVTDRRGLNLAMTDRTSDFFQADEGWWKSAFAGGGGSTYLGAVEYDESAKTYAMNIGIPIRDSGTNQVIGVLRGTLDISVLINTLGDVQVGRTGNIVLLDSDGLVLYSRTPEHFMKPAPDSILSLFKSEPRGWKRTNDLNGQPAVVAYSSLEDQASKALGWRVLVTQTWTEANQEVIRNLGISLVAGILVAVIAVVLCRFVILDSIVMPLSILTKRAHELSTGNVTCEPGDLRNNRINLRRDEIGDIDRAFNQLMIYFQGAASASTAIANDDLTITVTPNSANDVLGIAFEKMVHELKQIIGQVAENAEAVSAAASQLAVTSNQSGRATNQIAATIQQVALGTTQQSEDVSRTSSSIEQMGRTIAAVTRGAREQAKSIERASEASGYICSAVEQVMTNAQASAGGAREAAEAARAGVKTVEATIASMRTIQQTVGISTQKIQEMGNRSEQIDGIVETIEEIASQTNLLALNAAIEAARVESKGEKTVEGILQQHLLGVVNLLCNLLASGHEFNSNDLVNLAKQAGVESFSLTNADGVIVASNNPSSLGFRFSEDPRQESSAFRPLLNRRDGVVIRPIRERDQDSKPYLYVGVSRRDCPGIVQAGMAGDIVYRLGGYSRGFAVVAVEIRKLAEHAKEATREINTLISGIQKSVTEAVGVMEEGARHVERGSIQVAEAGDSLSGILAAAELVRQQVEEIVAAMQPMNISANELIKGMDAVKVVVNENVKAMQELTSGSNEVTRAIENIASVSEENSAAVEEVSASTEEVSAQVEQVSASAAALMDMAQDLQKIIARFKINLIKTETRIAA